MGNEMSEIGIVAARRPVRPRRRAGSVPADCRSRITNNPLRRANGNTAEGRRIRDLARAYLAQVENPNDPIVQADVIAAAENKALAEAMRLRALRGEEIDHAVLGQVENRARRAEARLGIGKRSRLTRLFP
jgi:hypothetical protein